MNLMGLPTLGSTRVSRAGERVLALANFAWSSALVKVAPLGKSLLWRDAAATDAKQRPGLPTNTRDACATQP
jgi:hypothetical protein